MAQDLLTVSSAAYVLGLSPNGLRRRIRTGVLEAFRVEGTREYRVPVGAVRRMISDAGNSAAALERLARARRI